MNYDAPEGSAVIMTPNLFITDEAWIEMVPNICKGICNMYIIRNHPYRWVILSLDGFGSYVNVIENHRIFTESNIYVVK